MRNHRLYGVIAREELEEAAVAPGEEVVAAPIEAGADSLEADLIEINDDIVDVQADEAATDEAAEVVEEMEVAVESLKIIAQNGGLCKGGAQILNQFQASWNRRIGEEATHGTLSAESFGSTNSRAGQTSLAAESIGEKAKSIWAAIVEMFKKAIAAIAGIWKRIFDGAARMKNRAANLSKAAAATTGEATAKTFEDQKLAENLHINGVVDGKAAAAAVAKEAEALLMIANKAASFAEAASHELTNPGPQEQGGKNLIMKCKALAQGGFSKVSDPASVGLSQMEHVEVYKGAAMPGNKAVVVIVPAGDEINDENVVALKYVGYKIGIFDASKKVADKAQLPTLSAADVKAIADQMVVAADHITQYRGAQKTAEKAAKDLIAAVEKVAAATGKANGAAEGDNKAMANLRGWLEGKIGQTLARCSMNMVTNAAPPVAAYVMNSSASVLQYGEQSLKQYGKVKAAEKTPAAAPAPAAA